MPYKTCKKCCSIKEEEEFYIRSKSHPVRRNICIECDRLYQTNFVKDNARPTPQSKTCASCDIDKDAAEFYKDKSKLDGLSTSCKRCKSVKTYIYRNSLHGKEVNRKIRCKPAIRFKNSFTRAARSGHSFEISKEQYILLVSKPCHYCGFDLSNESGIGLDRIDCDDDYISDNVIQCCAICNVARNDNFTMEEMEVIGKAIRNVRLARKA